MTKILVKRRTFWQKLALLIYILSEERLTTKVIKSNWFLIQCADWDASKERELMMIIKVKIWGIWLNSEKTWIKDQNGRVLWFPSKALAQADLDGMIERDRVLKPSGWLDQAEVKEIDTINIETADSSD